MEADVRLAALLALDAALGGHTLSTKAATGTVTEQVAKELLRPLQPHLDSLAAGDSAPRVSSGK